VHDVTVDEQATAALLTIVYPEFAVPQTPAPVVTAQFAALATHALLMSV